MNSIPDDCRGRSHSLAGLIDLTEGRNWTQGDSSPYGLPPLCPSVTHKTLRSLYDLGLRQLHDPTHGAPVEMAIPINGSWNGRVALSFDAFTGFTPRAPFVGEFVGQGLAFTRFPLPPEVRHFTAIDWDTLLPYTVRIARQHPELLSQGLIGFGYSQGGILVARWTELAGGTSGQEMASRLLSAHRMTPAGRAQFVADMDWLGAKLRDIGFEGYCAGTPHWGMHFTTSWWTQPIHWIVNDINPHLVPSYEPDHLVKFSARHLSGQVIVTSPHHIPSGSLIQIAVGTGMLTVHGLSTQPGGHDLFISAAASFVPGVRTVKFEETHIGFPTSREAAQAVVGLIEHPEPV